MEKQHKDCIKIPLSLDSVEAGVDTLIDILQQLKQDEDYSDISVVNTDKLEFFGEVLLTNEEYKEMLLGKIERAKYRIKIEQENLEEIENELKQIQQ